MTHLHIPSPAVLCKILATASTSANGNTHEKESNAAVMLHFDVLGRRRKKDQERCENTCSMLLVVLMCD